MIITLLIWLYTLCLLYLYGWLSLQWIAKLFYQQEQNEVSFVFTWLLGLGVVTTLASFLSLFMKTGLVSNLILLLGAAAIVIWARSTRQTLLPKLPALRKFHPLGLAVLLLVSITTLIISLGYPANSDTSIYHAQAIRWIENYKAVPGLGNLHTRLAYNPSWLLSNAIFSFSFLGIRSFHLLGSTFFLVAILYLTGGVNQLLSGNLKPAAILKTLFLPTTFLTLGAVVSSPGTDLPSALLYWVMIAEFADILQQDKPTILKNELRLSVLIMIGFFAVTIKLANLPLLLFSLYPIIHWLRNRQFRPVILSAIAGMLILAPWIARNVILSGYLLYPFPQIDIFSFDWKVPAGIADLDSKTIRSWGRIPGHDVFAALAMPLKKWGPIWFFNQTLNRRVILLLIAAAPPLYAIFWLFFRKAGDKMLGKARPFYLIYIVVYSSLIFWFFTAPLFRYGYGFLMAAFILSFLPAILWLVNIIKFKETTIAILVVSMLLLYQGAVLVRVINPSLLKQTLVLPVDYPTASTRPCDYADIPVACAEQWNACWYEPFPCIPDPNPALEMRGDAYQDGFRITQ